MSEGVHFLDEKVQDNSNNNTMPSARQEVAWAPQSTAVASKMAEEEEKETRSRGSKGQFNVFFFYALLLDSLFLPSTRVCVLYNFLIIYKNVLLVWEWNHLLPPGGKKVSTAKQATHWIHSSPYHHTTTILSSSFSQSLFCLTHATCRLLENRPNRRLRKVTNPGEKKQKNKMQLGPRKNKWWSKRLSWWWSVLHQCRRLDCSSWSCCCCSVFTLFLSGRSRVLTSST